MNQSHLEPQAITEFWKHDNEDMDLDADLLGLLQNNEGRDRKSKIKRHSRTKSHETGVQNKNISKEQFIENQRTKLDIEEEPDGHRNSIKPVKILSKIPLKSQHTLDEIGSPTQSPYSPSKFNPDYGQITERNITPVKYPAHQESHKKLLLIKKPSFNVGLSPVQNAVESTGDRRNHLKVSALLDAKRNQTPQQTLLPTINSFHVRTHSHTPTLPPLQKLIDHSPLNLGEEISPNKSSFSPMRQNYRDSKTSLRNFEIIPQSIDEVVPIVAASVPNREAHRSPTIIRGVREVSREYLREKSSMMTPLFQQASNMWAPEGNEDGLKSLIKLPRLKKNISSENSPSLLSSVQHENHSQNRIIKEGSPLNTLIDRKLTRVFTKATMNENIMFQKAASQQWRDMLGSTNE